MLIEQARLILTRVAVEPIDSLKTPEPSKITTNECSSANR
jgi:hypothetical protein